MAQTAKQAVKMAFKYAGLGIGTIGTGFAAYRSVRQIDTGFQGHRILFGKINPEPIHAGLALVNPFAEIVHMPLRKQKTKSEVNVVSKEGLIIRVDMDINYRLDPSKTCDIFSSIGMDYQDTFIYPLIKSTLRDVIAGYEGKDLYSEKSREKIIHELTQRITSRLEAEGFITDDVFINNLKLPPSITQAIEDKINAEQDNEKETHKLNREKKIAEFEIVKAKLEAQRLTEEALGIQAYQKLVSEGVSQTLLAWKYIEAVQAAASGPNNTIFVGDKMTIPTLKL